MVLAVKTLSLRAFRSYPRLDLSCGEGLIALAGPNGSGKTNILEAVSLLAPGRGLRHSSGGELMSRDGTSGWSIESMLATGSDPAELWTGGATDARRTARIDGKPATIVALGRVARMIWLTPALDRIFVEAPGERRKFLDRLTLSLEPDHASVSVRYERARTERNRLLKDGVDNPGWLSAVEAQMAQYGVEVGLARRRTLAALLEAQGDGAFPRAEAAITGSFEAILDSGDGREGFEARLRDGRAADMAAGRTLEGPHRSDLEVVYAEKNAPAGQCSTGEQKALLVSLVLANARALASRTGSAPIMLFDEIAAHFDSERRAALFAEIQGLGAQAWMTGTEWALFEALGSKAVRLSVQETDGRSEILGEN